MQETVTRALASGAGLFGGSIAAGGGVSFAGAGALSTFYSCTLAGDTCCTTAECGAGGRVLAVFPPQPKMAALRAAKMDRRMIIWFLLFCSAWHPPLLLSRKYIIQSPESAYSHYIYMILC